MVDMQSDCIILANQRFGLLTQSRISNFAVWLSVGQFESADEREVVSCIPAHRVSERRRRSSIGQIRRTSLQALEQLKETRSDYTCCNWCCNLRPCYYRPKLCGLGWSPLNGMLSDNSRSPSVRDTGNKENSELKKMYTFLVGK